jgi:hypothetical protein
LDCGHVLCSECILRSYKINYNGSEREKQPDPTPLDGDTLPCNECKTPYNVKATLAKKPIFMLIKGNISNVAREIKKPPKLKAKKGSRCFYCGNI